MKFPVPEIPGAYIIISGRKKKSDFPLKQHNTEVITSFLFMKENFAAEWEVKHGPIQIWEKAPEGDTEHPHYTFPFVKNTPLNCSQLAVEDNNLPQAFLEGNYRHIFSVLEEWADRE
jgi:hypothetical protein